MRPQSGQTQRKKYNDGCQELREVNGCQTLFSIFYVNLNPWQLFSDPDRIPNIPWTPNPFHKKHIHICWGGWNYPGDRRLHTVWAQNCVQSMEKMTAFMIGVFYHGREMCVGNHIGCVCWYQTYTRSIQPKLQHGLGRSSWSPTLVKELSYWQLRATEGKGVSFH